MEKKFDIENITGISEEDITRKLNEDGFNELPSQKKQSIFTILINLLPAHIAFLELIIDPACSVVFEAEKDEKNIMQRPPRNLKDKLFDRKNLIRSLFQGLSVLFFI